MNILSKIAITLLLVLGLGGLVNLVGVNTNAQTQPLTMTHVPDKGKNVEPGETISYTITITNTSSSPITNIFIKSPLSNLNYTLGSGQATKTSPAGAIALADDWYQAEVNLGTLNPGAVINITYKGTVPNNAADGSYAISNAQIKWVGNPVGFNIQATTQVNNKPLLCAIMTSDKSQVAPGDTIEYTIELCNSGNRTLHNVVIKGWVPNIGNPLSTYVRNSTTLVRAGTVTALNDDWIVNNTAINVSDINPGAKTFIKYKVTVNAGVKDGTILESVAQAKSDETPEIQCANQVKVVVPVGAPQIVTAQVQPTLSVKKFVIWNNQEWEGGVPSDKHKFAPGEEVTYRIRVFNNTEARAKDVKAEDRLQEPFNLEFVRSSPKEDSWNNSNKILSVTLGDMVPKSEKVWEFVFKVRSGIETNKDIDQKDVVVVTSSNAGEARAETKVTLFAPTAPVAPARKVARPAELPRAGAETGAALLILGLGPLGLILRRFKLI